MIAAHDHGAGLDQGHHGIDGPFRIGAVADDIAKADHPLRALRARGVEAGGEGLPVGMDVGEDGQPQYFLRSELIKSRACES